MSVAQRDDARSFQPANDLSPAAIEAFLKVAGWEQVDKRDGVFAVWESEREDASLLLPYNRAYRDYRARLSDALETIADIYKLTSSEALELKITGAQSDILLLRADQPTIDGSIPLEEAQGLLSGVNQMMLAAACSAIRPRASNRGRKPEAAAEFLKEVRMGHTMRGSFVITIYARHDDPGSRNHRPRMSGRSWRQNP
ncbi:hypothetical protein Sru01_40230 [Sphaerisporangium rufum]|uniref:Uncharacterized protein n=1 Tax=Sphaerisporangium rufum TaxID=1381558 RepID=A0A919R3I5_9ACTN|nr:hypothetical protein [Sphaerisporangium rufum]GII79041.1 hypothetical protein Sru01_40230 [Sphaerisporangium rufum]